MLSLVNILVGLLALSVVSFATEYSPIFIDSAGYDDLTFLQSRNFLQQLLINQIVNILPANIRDGINDAAAIFQMTRNDFLLRCLKELQAFQTYSKIDFITAIQKTIKFVDEKLTNEEKQTLEKLEPEGIAFVKLLFSSKLQQSHLNEFYDLLVKVVRQTIDGATLATQLPALLHNVLMQYN